MKSGKLINKQLDFKINKFYNLERVMTHENDTIKQLIGYTSQVLEKYKKQYAETGEQFNIFSLLNAETNEVKTHSRFIGELLNPRGKHAQGTIFLDLFLDTVKNNSFTSHSCKIQIEKYIGKKQETSGGRIDILMIDHEKNFICIENKIYAIEQKNQLTRYQEFAKKYKNPIVYYLTLFGSESNSTSDKENVVNISYKYHIVKWLESCIAQMENKPYLREALSQYLQLIKKLTNQTELNMNQEIENIVLENQDKLNAYLKLHDSFTNIKSKMIYSIAQRIIHHLETNVTDLTIKKIRTISQPTHSKYRGTLVAFSVEDENQGSKIYRLVFKEKAFRKLVLVPTNYDHEKQKFVDNSDRHIPITPQNWLVSEIQEIYFDENYEHLFWQRLVDSIDQLIKQ